MAQQMICDFDGTNVAILLVTNLATGDTQKVCPEHIPMWTDALLAVFSPPTDSGLPGTGTGAGQLDEAPRAVDLDQPAAAGPDDDEDDDQDEQVGYITVDLPGTLGGDDGDGGGQVPNDGHPAAVPAAGGDGGQ